MIHYPGNHLAVSGMHIYRWDILQRDWLIIPFFLLYNSIPLTGRNHGRQFWQSPRWVSLWTFLTLRLTRVFLFTDKIQSLLNITADLIKICFDCNYTLADESIDLEQVSDQLVELLRILKPFKAAAANSLGNGLSADVVDGLLSRCKSEMSRMETMLKRKSGRKRIEGSSSSFDPQTITSLVSSITALREVVEGYCRCVCTFAKKYNADNVHKGPLLIPMSEIRGSISIVSFE